jgi:cysteine desulfurase
MKAYLDYAATTPLHPKVLEKMLPFLKDEFGNPSSIHSLGRNARVAVEEARETIASFINADAGEIYFTSGGTEANNFAVRGIAAAEYDESHKNKVITSKQEHSCVRDSVKELSKNGFVVDFLPPQADGTSGVSEISKLLDDKVSLVTAIHTNNETGAVNDIPLLAHELKDKQVYLHTDTVQSFGKIKIDVKELGADSLCASAHKINGPKGIGFAYIKSGTPATPLIRGGAQERNRRGGTENVANIVGFAEAVRIAGSEMESSREKVTMLKNAMAHGIKAIDSIGMTINSGLNSSPYILSLTFDSRYYNNDPEAILIFLDINGVAASNGAACSSGALKPSHVILSMGKSLEDAKGTVRFSFSARTATDEINYALDVLQKMSARFRK